MQIVNIHQCRLEAGMSRAGGLIDELASVEDRFWPNDRWPTMRLDRPLAVGATGGHGPIGYKVEAYQPGLLARFRFTRPSEFIGHHWLEVQPDGQQGSILLHTIDMQASLKGWISWWFLIRPLHDALLEDAFCNARVAMGMPEQRRPWSLWVRMLRRVRYGSAKLKSY
jgi:hypothetical protein